MNIQEERLKKYIEAEEKALHSQEYTIDGVKTRRADLSQIGQGISTLLATGASAGTKKSNKRTRRVLLRDY